MAGRLADAAPHQLRRHRLVAAAIRHDASIGNPPIISSVSIDIRFAIDHAGGLRRPRRATRWERPRQRAAASTPRDNGLDQFRHLAMAIVESPWRHRDTDDRLFNISVERP